MLRKIVFSCFKYFYKIKQKHASNCKINPKISTRQLLNIITWLEKKSEAIRIRGNFTIFSLVFILKKTSNN